MLYTFSKAHYDNQELQSFLSHLTANDAVVMWQDGVLQAVKNPQFFANCAQVFLLEDDVTARGLNAQLSAFQMISLAQFVTLTEQYTPQIAL